MNLIVSRRCPLVWSWSWSSLVMMNSFTRMFEWLKSVGDGEYLACVLILGQDSVSSRDVLIVKSVDCFCWGRLNKKRKQSDSLSWFSISTIQTNCLSDNTWEDMFEGWRWCWLTANLPPDWKEVKDDVWTALVNDHTRIAKFKSTESPQCNTSATSKPSKAKWWNF